MNMPTLLKQSFAALALALCLALSLVPAAYADEALGDVDEPNVPNTAKTSDVTSDDSAEITISKDGNQAYIDGAEYAFDDFSRAQKGSNRSIDGTYYGYAYLVGDTTGEYLQLIAGSDYAVLYVPEGMAQQFNLNLEDGSAQLLLKQYLNNLDNGQAAGSTKLSNISTWYFTSDTSYTVGSVQFNFDVQANGNVYATTIGTDGSDLTQASGSAYFKPSFGDFAKLADPDSISIVEASTGLAAVQEFLTTLDWSPLWVTMKTTGVAIVFIFILGLLAAYWCLHLSQRWRNVMDSVFTIPMVLPPTVCGFILLYLCGSNTAFGQFFIDIGFPLIFSWPATVIAAVVVAFPLMYRSALGAFENLDPNMLDAARTLGWSNARIFIKLMLPLSWSSIAAGTVLAFARALGEFGATLFLAGNYLGITRTIPIAIYFEWMNGNGEVAWFWTAIVIAFSFLVILFINLWSSRTTKYRKGAQE